MNSLCENMNNLTLRTCLICKKNRVLQEEKICNTCKNKFVEFIKEKCVTCGKMFNQKDNMYVECDECEERYGGAEMN